VAKVAGLSVSAASHQLKRWRDRGVVSFRKKGRLALYRLSDAQGKPKPAPEVADIARAARLSLAVQLAAGALAVGARLALPSRLPGDPVRPRAAGRTRSHGTSRR